MSSDVTPESQNDAMTPAHKHEQKDARTPGMDEVVIYDAVQRLIHRIDQKDREIEALRNELAPGKFDPHPPRLVVDADGYVWRDYGEYYSMCPGTSGNEPIAQPVTFYEPVQLTYVQEKRP